MACSYSVLEVGGNKNVSKTRRHFFTYKTVVRNHNIVRYSLLRWKTDTSGYEKHVNCIKTVFEKAAHEIQVFKLSL